MIRNPRIIPFIATLSLAALPSPAWADSGKDESGKGRHGGEYKYEEKHDRGGHVKREWKSGDCKYEYKSGPGGVKEEYECGRDGRHAGPPAWIPPGLRGRAHRTAHAQPPLDLGAGHCDRETIGRILGAGAGAAVGSQIGSGSGRLVAVAGGTLLGFLIGGEIGNAMDQTDRLCVDQALEDAPDGRTIAWNQPSGGRYAVTPRRTYETRDGRYCREYLARSTIGGESAQSHGTACRQPDGSWKIVN